MRRGIEMLVEKILLVSHEMTYTGAPNSLLKIGKLLKDNGLLVDVWTLKDGAFKEEFQKEGLLVDTVSFPSDASENFALRIKKYDIVVANTIFCASFARYAQRFTRTFLYVREAENIPQIMQDCGLEEEDFVECENKVCVSEYARHFIEKKYGLKGVTVIPNFVEDAVRTKQSHSFDRIIFKGSKNNLNFLVSGTLEPRKGQDIAVQAYLLLNPEERKHAKLHIVGAQPEWAEEYQRKLHLDKEKGIIYHGQIKNRNDLMNFYNDMDVFLVPSRDESCSLVALEACMLGKTVILTENTGAKYLVDPSCIVKTESVEELQKKMSKAIQNPQWLQSMGQYNRNSYLEKGSRELYKKNLLSYLEHLGSIKHECERVTKLKVSVIVPVYNVDSYLCQCMDSICNQTLKDIEVICVNDGSTDSSADILETYKNKDSRIRMIHTENRGYGHAMNVGMQAAKGEYIGIVEPDDFIAPDMYEILYHRALCTNAEIVKSDFYRFYGEKEERKEVYNKVARVKDNYNRIIRPYCEKECFRFIMNTWPGIYKRSFLLKYKIRHNETPGASFQDNGFWFQGFCQAKRITFVDKALYYNRRDNPGSSVNNREKIYCANDEYAWIRDFLAENPVLEKEFLYQYSLKKYHTYLFTLDRIDWEYKREYVHRFAQEFREAEEKGELNQAVFTPQEWAQLHWLMRDEKEYYEKQILGEIQISVVVPVYNSEKYLDKCLSSLENQTFRKIEIICIDDGSEDSSGKIIDKFVARDRRFRKVKQENKGAGAARNKGLSIARGEYIIFLDSDDFFEPEMLKDAYDRIRMDDAEVCVMGSWQYNEQTGETVPCRYSLQLSNYPVYRPFRVENMTKNPFRCFMGWAWDKLYLKRFLLNHNLHFQEIRTTNDMYFTYMSLFKAGKITTLNKRLIHQRRNRENSLSVTRDKSWDCFLKALLAMKQELIEMGIYDKNNLYFMNYALHSTLWNLGTLPDKAAGELYDCLLDKHFFDFGFHELKKGQIEYSHEEEEFLELCKNKEKGIALCQRRYQKPEQEPNMEDLMEVETDSKTREEYYRYCLDEIRKSKSYKIGLAVTWLPRKIRGW